LPDFSSGGSRPCRECRVGGDDDSYLCGNEMK